MKLSKYDIGKAILGLGTIKYLKDVWEVYQIVSASNQCGETGDIDEAEERKLLAAYADPQLIDKDEFRKVLHNLEQQLDDAGECGLFQGLDDPALPMFREIGTALTARCAVALQIAHPYIAKGVMMHSNVLTNTLDRAEKTQRYTNAMLFGSKRDVLSAANQVRHLHGKVKGEIGEQVGIFSPDSPYDANQRDAVTWVAATMPITVKMSYELLHRPVTEQEKDAIVRVNQRFMMCFGVTAPYNNWKEYETYYVTMVRAKDLLKPSEACYDLIVGLSATRGGLARYINRYFKYLAYCLLPNRLSLQMHGRAFNRLDYLIVAMEIARIRFFYRLLPEWLRFVSPYHFMVRRHGRDDRWSITNMLIDRVAALGPKLLQRAFTSRTKEEVQEILEVGRRDRRKLGDLKSAPNRV